MTLDQEEEISVSSKQTKNKEPAFDPVKFLDDYIQNQKTEVIWKD